MLRRIYLDNSATTPIAPEVLEAMLPYLQDKFGNASSIHFFGQEARAAVDKARHQIAALINARPAEIIFTSGGTEANNLAIRGLLESQKQKPDNKGGRYFDAQGDRKVHIVTTQIEHPAVKNVCEDIEKLGGYEVTYLPVYENGVIRIEDLKAAIRDHTGLISIMTANNEIGTIQPIEEIGQLVKELRSAGRKIYFHSDAVQAAGKMPVDVEAIGCDLLSISAHKIYAPKGVGALYVRRGVRLQAQNVGGRQERGTRGGTESVPNIVAFGRACELAAEELEESSTRLGKLRDRFEQGVFELIGDVTNNGDTERRLPNISNLSFKRIEGEGLLINLDMAGVAISTGSACSSGSLEPSPVIRALGRDDELARGAIRFSFGRFNTEEDVTRVLEVLPAAVENLRRLSPGAKTMQPRKNPDAIL
ncbi:MAG TPA: cysteine desulfurase family protein [Pyrinomonadaceae bacterium]|nr:cysteine desulfurase family protein [Pyrinomonadaceae bacterium]